MTNLETRVKRVRFPLVLLAACVLAAVLAASAVGAAAGQAASAYGSEVLAWSREIRLTKGHFKAKVPSAEREAAHSWVGLDVSWECREGRGSWYASAVFDPARSWWPPPIPGVFRGIIGDGMSRAELESRRTALQRDDEDLLRHEQLHFDLTELAARKIRQRLEGLQRACATPGARKGDRRYRARMARRARCLRQTDRSRHQSRQTETMGAAGPPSPSVSHT